MLYKYEKFNLLGLYIASQWRLFESRRVSEGGLGTAIRVYICILILLIPLSVGVDITFVEHAKSKGAVCMDGSPGAYQLDQGVGNGKQKWIIFLEGGGWCSSSEECVVRLRTRPYLASSYSMTPSNFSGILANKPSFNPYFYNWNRVLIRYCDGGSYMGNTLDPNNGLQYRGAKIFKAIVKELLRKGMQNATHALLAGSSAGGIGAILNCNRFTSFLSTTTTTLQLKCLSDAAYAIHVKDYYGGYYFTTYIQNVLKLHRLVKYLPKSCTSVVKPKTLCFFPPYVLPHVKIPIFLTNSVYDYHQLSDIFMPNMSRQWRECMNNIGMCSSTQISIWKGFRSMLVKQLPRERNGSFRGMFIDSCVAHGQAQYSIWHGKNVPTLNHKTMAEAVGEWMIGGKSFQEIDYVHVVSPINCSRFLPPQD